MNFFGKTRESIETFGKRSIQKMTTEEKENEFKHAFDFPDTQEKDLEVEASPASEVCMFSDAFDLPMPLEKAFNIEEEAKRVVEEERREAL